MCLVPSIHKHRLRVIDGKSALGGTLLLVLYLGCLVSDVANAQNLSDAAPRPPDILEFMVMEPGDEALLYSEAPPAFVPDGEIGPRGFLERGVLLRVRVRPKEPGLWNYSDCRLTLEPGFLSFHARWLYPNLPELDLERGRRMESLDWRRVICQEFEKGVEFYEFVLKSPARMSFHVKQSASSELFVRSEHTAFGFLTGMAMMATCLATLLAFYFRSGRLILQCAGLALTLLIMHLRYNGPLAGLIGSEFVTEVRLNVRIGASINLIYWMHVLVEFESRIAKRFVWFVGLSILGVALIPLSVFFEVFGPAALIWIGVFSLSVAFLLNLSALFFSFSGKPQLAIRLFRCLTLSLLALETATLLTEVNIQGLLPLWCISILAETFTAVILVTRSHRAETELSESLDRQLSDLSSESLSLQHELNDIEESYGGVLAENDTLEQANSELVQAMSDVSTVEEALTERRQRLHFTELLGFRLAGLGHDLMNPLGLARGVMEVIPSDAWTSEERRVKEQFIDEIDRMTALRTAVRVFGRPEAQATNTEAPVGRLFHVNSVLSGSIDLFKLSNEACSISVDATEDVFLNGFASDLSRVVVELLSNASRAASRTDRPPKIKIKLSNLGTNTVLEFHDSGPGFSENDTASLAFGFIRESVDAGPTEFHLGFGLVMAARLVGELGGKLEVMDERSELGGAVVKVSLPMPERQAVLE